MRKGLNTMSINNNGGSSSSPAHVCPEAWACCQHVEQPPVRSRWTSWSCQQSQLHQWNRAALGQDGGMGPPGTLGRSFSSRKLPSLAGLRGCSSVTPGCLVKHKLEAYFESCHLSCAHSSRSSSFLPPLLPSLLLSASDRTEVG